MTGRLNVPQIFLNNQPIGGYQELKFIHQEGGIKAYLNSQTSSDSPDDRLKVPTAPPKNALVLDDIQLRHVSETTSISGVEHDDWEIRQMLASSLKNKEKGCCLSIDPHSFPGSQAVSLLQKTY